MPPYRTALLARSAGWSRDEKNRLILLKIPPQVNLNPRTSSPLSNENVDINNDTSIDRDSQHTGTKTAAITFTPEPAPASLENLPAEIVHEIAKRLHPVDRVCLALTCKPLARAIVSAPRLTRANWSQFSDHRFEWLPPESFSLILRLAHGWIPKDKLRYCWKCHKIMPRDAAFFHRRLACKRNPKWSAKVDLPKHEWDKMRKKDKYKHLIQTWCTSPSEDSSCLYCDVCRDSHLEAGLFQLAHPVECPTCLERELTYVWRRPRKPWFRKWLCAVFGLAWAAVLWIVQQLTIYLLLFGSATFGLLYHQGCRCWRAFC